MKRLIILSACLLLIAACSSPSVLISNDKIDDIKLNQSSALLLFALDTQSFIKSIHIKGPSDVKIISKQYQLVSLRPGNYELFKIEFSEGFIPIRKTQYPDIWEFEIKPNAINYVGHFQLEKHEDISFSFALHNKSTTALKYMEENHSELLDRESFVYSGADRDDFLSYVSQLKGVKND